MAKRSNNAAWKKSNSSRPYDVSNSFVKRVATLIPKPLWLSRWLAPADGNEVESASSSSTNSVTGNEFTDHDEEDVIQPPPNKKPRIPVNQHPPTSFAVSPITDGVVNHHNSNHRTTNRIQNDLGSNVPGPSGLSSRTSFVSSTPMVQETVAHISEKASEARVNGDDHSESSESTSGCSSLVPQVSRQSQSNETVPSTRRSIQEKLNFTGHLQSTRSLFPDRDRRHTPRPNSSLGGQAPSFSVSTFSSASSSLSRLTPRVLSSPFYSGRTTYGGASAYRKRGSSSSVVEVPTPARRGIQVRPAAGSESEVVTMSSSARRILEVLDQFSTPVMDARRIPLQETPPSSRKLAIARPLTRELTVPTVPDLLRLQDATEAARKVATSSSVATDPWRSEYRLRTMDVSEPEKYSGKIKSKKAVFTNEEVEEVNLPNVTLPITTLPKFDFVVPQTVELSAENMFKFASPITVTSRSRTVPSVNNFTFSSPLSVQDSQQTFTHTNNQPSTNCADNVTSSAPSISITMQFKSGSAGGFTPKRLKPKNNGQNIEVNFGPQPAPELKVGSVMDILGKKPDAENQSSSEAPLSLLDKFKPVAGSWDCSACMICNKPESKQCVACTTPRPIPWQCGTCKAQNESANKVCVLCKAQRMKVPATEASSGFGKQFMPAADTWECSECLVRNQESAGSCVACNTARKSRNPDAATAHKQTTGFGDKFKPPSGSWECHVCFVQNTQKATKCVACESVKPCVTKRKQAETKPENVTTSSGFGDKFKKPEGSWSCPTCMVSNKSTDLKCAACEEAKPGITSDNSKSNASIKFNFEIPPEASSFNFGINKAEAKPTDSSAALPTTNGKMSGFVFGETKVSVAESQFSFGVKPVASSTVQSHSSVMSTPPSFQFGTTTTAGAVVPVGVSTVETALSKVNESASKSTESVFKGADNSITVTDSDMNQSDASLKPPESVFKKTSSPQFKFGENFTKPDEDTNKPTSSVATSTQNSSVGFKFGSSRSVKSQQSSPFARVPKSGAPAATKESPKRKLGGDFDFKLPDSSSKKENTASLTAKSSPFTFGSHAATASVESTGVKSDSPLKPSFSFPAASSNTASPGITTIAFTSPKETVTSSARSFDLTSSTNPASSTTAANFSSSAESSVTTTASSLFAFGAAKPTATFGLPSTTTAPVFGQTNGPSVIATSVGTFGAKPFAFSTNESKDGPSSSSKKQAVPFGSTVPATSSGVTFGEVTTSTASIGSPAFGSGSAASPFGAAASGGGGAASVAAPSTLASAPSFSAGAGDVSKFGTPTTTTAAQPVFGSGAAPSFGFPAQSGTKTVQPSEKPGTAPFMFGSSATNPLQPPAFAFSNTQPASSGGSSEAAKPASFGFGAQSNTTSTPSGGFNFVPSNPTAPSPRAAFTFGSNMPASSPSAAPSFGAASSTPAASGSTLFGSSATPAFGATNPSTSFSVPAFSFGSNTQPASNVFGFSASQPAQLAAPATPFAFGQAPSSQQAAPPTFNPNVRPTFNFTGGETPSFTAAGAPGTSAAPVRRFKKAMRRTHQR